MDIIDAKSLNREKREIDMLHIIRRVMLALTHCAASLAAIDSCTCRWWRT